MCRGGALDAGGLCVGCVHTCRSLLAGLDGKAKGKAGRLGGSLWLGFRHWLWVCWRVGPTCRQPLKMQLQVRHTEAVETRTAGTQQGEPSTLRMPKACSLLL